MVTIHEDRDGEIDLAAARATELRPVRGPAAARSARFSAASNVTGIVSDTRGDLAPPPRARRAVVLRLRGRRAVRGDRDGPGRRPARGQGRGVHLARTSSSAGPGTPGVLVARRDLFRNRVPIDARRRHRRLRQPARARLPRRHRAPRGGRHAGHRGVDPGRASCSGSRPPWASTPSASARTDFIHRALHRWERQPGDRDPGQPHGRAALDRVVRGPPRRAATCTTTSWSRCSTTCSGSSRAAAARAPGPYGHRLLGIDLETVARVRARDLPRLRGDQARLGAGQLQLLHQRGRVRVHPRRGGPRGDRGLAAAAATTRSTRPPACGATARACPSRRCRCATSATTDGAMTLPVAPPPRAGVAAGRVPRRGARAPRAAAARRSPAPTSRPRRVGPDFEALRWFLLPEEVASGG